MVKNNVLLMSILSLGFTLGSGVEAVKNEFVNGPMDKYVIRKLAVNSDSQDAKENTKKIMDFSAPTEMSNFAKRLIKKKLLGSKVSQASDKGANFVCFSPKRDKKKIRNGLTPLQQAYILKTT